jgi:hypothetical protein
MCKRNFWTKPAFLLPVLLAAALLFGGCENPTDTTGTTQDPLTPDIGYFKGDTVPPYDDGIGFTATHFYYYDNGALDIGYAGKIVTHIPDDEAEGAGIIIIQITDGGTWNKTVDSYYAIAYLDYGYHDGTDSAIIRQSSAYKANSEKNNGVPAIEEAITEYTVANGYFPSDPESAYYARYRKYRSTIPQADAALTLTGLEGVWAGEDGDEEAWTIRIANPMLTWASDVANAFAGTIVDITETDGTSGYIYIKLDYVSTMGDYSDLEAGNYYAIRYKDKAGGSIKLCAAYGDNTEGTATLAEAKTTYTVDNEYFDDDYYVTPTP